MLPPLRVTESTGGIFEAHNCITAIEWEKGREEKFEHFRVELRTSIVTDSYVFIMYWGYNVVNIYLAQYEFQEHKDSISVLIRTLFVRSHLYSFILLCVWKQNIGMKGFQIWGMYFKIDIWTEKCRISLIYLVL